MKSFINDLNGCDQSRKQEERNEEKSVEGEES